MPDEQVGVAGVAVHVCDEGVEPDDGCAKLRRGREPGGGIEPQRAGQEVQGHIGAAAPLEQFPDLRVGLRGRKAGIEVDYHDLRDEQPQGPADLARDNFGDERLHAVAGAAELGHVEAVVVRLHDRGERSALAQWSDIACGRDVTQHAASIVPRRVRCRGRTTARAARILATRTGRPRLAPHLSPGDH